MAKRPAPALGSLLLPRLTRIVRDIRLANPPKVDEEIAAHAVDLIRAELRAMTQSIADHEGDGAYLNVALLYRDEDVAPSLRPGSIAAWRDRHD